MYRSVGSYHRGMGNKSSREEKRAYKMVLDILSILGVLYFVFWGGLRFYAEARTLLWTATYGVVSEKSVTTKPFLTRSGSRKSYYACHIRYLFQVDGKSYHNNRIYPYDPSYDWYPAYESADEKYSKGDKVLIYYNPSRPNEACVKPEFSYHTGLYLLLAAGIFYANYYWLNIYKD